MRGDLITKRGWQIARPSWSSDYANIFDLHSAFPHTNRHEAHVFHEIDDKKTEKYRKRKIRRMREDSRLVDSFRLDGTYIFVLRTDFNLQIDDEEQFPRLVNHHVCSSIEKEQWLQQRPRLAYSVVLKNAPTTPFADSLQATSRIDSSLEREVTQTESKKGRRRKKQQSRRRTQRQSKKLRVGDE